MISCLIALLLSVGIAKAEAVLYQNDVLGWNVNTKPEKSVLRNPGSSLNTEFVQESGVMKLVGPSRYLIVNTPRDKRIDPFLSIISWKESVFRYQFAITSRQAVREFIPAILTWEKGKLFRGEKVILLLADRATSRKKRGVCVPRRLEDNLACSLYLQSHGAAYILDKQKKAGVHYGKAVIHSCEQVDAIDRLRADNLNPGPISSFQLPLHNSDLLVSSVGLRSNLLKREISQASEHESSGNSKNLQARFNLWPPGAALSLFGFVVFAYGYWNAKFGPNINSPWLPVMVFGGLAIFTWGIFILLAWSTNPPLDSF